MEILLSRDARNFTAKQASRPSSPHLATRLLVVCWRRLDLRHVRHLRRLFQAHQSSVLGARVDCLVVLRDTCDALPRRMDADGPALEASGAAVSASTYDVARSVGASAHIRPRRGRGVSPHPPVVPPQTSD